MTMTQQQTTQNYSVDPDIAFELPTGGGGGRPDHLRPGPFIAKLARVTKAPDGQYGKNMYWFWELHNTGDSAKDLIPVAFNENGSIWQYREMTSVKFGKGKTKDKTAKARVRAEALLRREIDEAEDLRSVLEQLPGKAAFLYLTLNENGYLDVEMVERYKAGMLAPLQKIEEETAATAEDDEVPF